VVKCDLGAIMLCRTACPFERRLECAELAVKLIDQRRHPVGIYAGIRLRDDNQMVDDLSRKVVRASMIVRRNAVQLLRKELNRLRGMQHDIAS
jgi:hypothetical protein